MSKCPNCSMFNPAEPLTLIPCPFDPMHEISIQCSVCDRMKPQSKLFISPSKPFWYICTECIHPRAVRMVTDDSELFGKYGIAGKLQEIGGYRYYPVIIPGWHDHPVRFMTHQVEFLIFENGD